MRRRRRVNQPPCALADHGAKDTFDREARRGRIVGRGVGGLIVEVAQRLAQPPVLVVSCLARQSV